MNIESILKSMIGPTDPLKTTAFYIHASPTSGKTTLERSYGGIDTDGAYRQLVKRLGLYTKAWWRETTLPGSDPANELHAGTQLYIKVLLSWDWQLLYGNIWDSDIFKGHYQGMRVRLSCFVEPALMHQRATARGSYDMSLDRAELWFNSWRDANLKAEKEGYNEIDVKIIESSDTNTYLTDAIAWL